MNVKRLDHQPPSAIARRGWKYHHLGIPTTIPRRGERHLRSLGMYVSGFSTSACGIEWMRFEPGSQVSELVRTVPHIAFEVEDLESALRGCTLLSKVSSPSKNVRVAMIVDNGAPIELIEFSNKKRLAPTTRRSKR